MQGKVAEIPAEKQQQKPLTKGINQEKGNSCFFLKPHGFFRWTWLLSSMAAVRSGRESGLSCFGVQVFWGARLGDPSSAPQGQSQGTGPCSMSPPFLQASQRAAEPPGAWTEQELREMLRITKPNLWDVSACSPQRAVHSGRTMLRGDTGVLSGAGGIPKIPLLSRAGEFKWCHRAARQVIPSWAEAPWLLLAGSCQAGAGICPGSGAARWGNAAGRGFVSTRGRSSPYLIAGGSSTTGTTEGSEIPLLGGSSPTWRLIPVSNRQSSEAGG